jgi:hypothetical protein
MRGWKLQIAELKVAEVKSKRDGGIGFPSAICNLSPAAAFLLKRKFL